VGRNGKGGGDDVRALPKKKGEGGEKLPRGGAGSFMFFTGVQPRRPALAKGHGGYTGTREISLREGKKKNRTRSDTGLA